MNKLTFRIASAIVGVFAVLAIAGHFLGPDWLTFVFTPLTTLVLVLIAFSQWLLRRGLFALWVAIGLVFSLCGDVLLLWPDRFFAAGLGAFLCTHIAYLIAFKRDTKFPAQPVVWLLYLLSAGGLSAVLWSAVPSGLRVPVVIYSIFLSTMAAQAMGRWMVLRTKSARATAVGALFFMASDTLLAIDRFRTHIPSAAIFVLGTYFIGQWLITCSADDEMSA
jgi:uncharacterized membrane protein YhhN